MNVAKQENRIIGRADKTPLTLLKPALAFKEDGSTCKIEVAFVEQAVGELISVDGYFLLEKRLVEKD